jgi:transmembrane sensor
LVPQDASLVADVATYETAVGGISKVELSDGSSIALNTNSRVEVSFNEHQRVIKLERGEIHIDVAHDPSRPLSVIVGGRVVQAVGTAFSVKIDDSQRVEILVADGRVKVGIQAKGTRSVQESGEVSANGIAGDALLISQGERVVLGDSSEELEMLEPEEIEVELSWREGNLVFRGESLVDAAAEISRYTPVEFVILDEDLQSRRVGGFFKAGDVAGFLDQLRTNFNIVYERVDDQTILLSEHKDAPN